VANSKYKFFEDIWSTEFQHYQKGFPSTSLSMLFGNLDSISYKIPLARKYRPDLIAQDYYGDVSLYWVLIYANNFNNSPVDFYVSRIIKIPKFESVLSSM
jgi:hypothetical protein